MLGIMDDGSATGLLTLEHQHSPFRAPWNFQISSSYGLYVYPGGPDVKRERIGNDMPISFKSVPLGIRKRNKISAPCPPWRFPSSAALATEPRVSAGGISRVHSPSFDRSKSPSS